MKHKHQDVHYGYYHGGDPRKFSPDYESNTPEEIERWTQACVAWERGERPDPGGPHIPLIEGGQAIGHITIAHYGLGISELEWDCDEPDCTEGPEDLGAAR